MSTVLYPWRPGHLKQATDAQILGWLRSRYSINLYLEIKEEAERRNLI